MTTVAIKDCASYDQELLSLRLDETLALLGGWERFVKPGMRVLLKVNLIGPKSSETGAVTHAEFVRAAVRKLKARGCEAWIGDSAGGAIAGIAPTARGFEVAGYAKVAEEEGAILKNFEREGSVECRPADAAAGSEAYHLAKPAFDADLVINLPKLKTHSAATYTGAFKNLYGCVPGLKKAEYHRIAPNTHDFGRVIADINACVKPGLHLMDGVVAMQGKGPTAGTPYPAGTILASTDPLALDAVACAMLGLELAELPIFDSARERGLGEWRLGSIAVAGDHRKPPRLAGFDVPKAMKVGKVGGKVFGIMINMMKKRPLINLGACRNCGTCMESCPVKAIDRQTKAIDYAKCIECLCCHELCMYGAVELVKAKKARAAV
jgi:uncharacterized protein (DUF362 family)/Pyruvate/2-oxoacid:ferredoxin oxidoreductase delta subunit